MDRFDDPKIYRQKRESFTRSLQHFHEARGTPFRKIPVFCGKEVDLFRLYNVVTQRGGWVKVNRTNQWKDILPEFNIPKGCVNGGNALKQIYLRYLDRYEKVHYLGESSDRHDLEEEEVETGRHRPRWSSRSVHSVPLTYNHHQHNIIENLRKYSGLSSDIYKASDYDRLALSLVSPLPNEQDFAINVCTLLSNEGKHTLKLEKCPKIIDFLLAHAGVYNHSNLRVLFEEVYGKIRGHSLTTFWSDVLETTELLDLTDENNFTKHFPKSYTFYKTSSRTNDVIEKSASDTFETNKNSFYKKCETRTVVHSNLPVSESKENSTTRMPDSSEKSTNSIQDSLNAGKQSARDDSGINNLNKTESTKNDIANRNDEKTVVNSETLNLNSLNGLGVEKAFECDSVSENLPETSTSVGNEISIKNVELSTTKESENLSKTDFIANDNVTSAERSESKISPSKECISVKSDGSESSGKSDSQVLDQKGISNEELNPSLEPMEIGKEEHETGGNKELGTHSESFLKVHDEENTVQTGFSETKVEEKEETQENQFKTPEEVILTEEARLKEQERLRKEKERLEAEELARKEAENIQRIEEERQKAAEEAVKLEKQLKEAEMYEAMLKEEEKKKKVYYFDEEETPPKKPNRCVLKIEPEDLELFCLGRQNGTHDYIGQRVLQVAHILRNLTFCEESMPVMAKNTTFLRFLLLCINSKWSSLNQLGLDMLGNISPELTIEDPSIDRLSQTFFWTVHRGIQHSNRFFIISCLEILNKICQKDENEDVVCKNLDQSVYDQVCRLLSLHDIMILLYTLECLYSMSSMGEKACTYICRSKGAIEMLLALITVEAQSYGPKACILMRVIETVSGTAASNPPPVVQPPAAPSPNPITQMTGTLVQSCSPQTVPSVATASTMTVQQGAVPKIVTPTIVRASSPKTIVGMPMAAVATPVQLSTSPIPNVVPALSSVQQQHAHQQTVQENEQFALAWLRATFELSAGGKVEQQEVYRRYVDSCSKMGRKGVITAVHFPRFVRSVFGGTVGPKSMPIPPAELKPNGPTAQSYYEGIKVRDVPLTINIKIVPVTEVPRPVTKKRPPITTPKAKSKRKKPDSPTSPILKAQLISPNKPPPSPSPSPSIAVLDGKAQVSTQTPGQLMLGQSSSPPCTPPPMDNSTLIKSLLASKVSEICMTAPLGMLSDNTQVVQRQQQNQKILQQQLQGKAESPKAKVIRLNGIIQDPVGAISENHLAAAAAKGKKEPPQPPPLVAAGGTAANALRPKTPKMDEDSDSMASTSRDCTAAGGGNVSSADDNDNSLTSFEGIFNGIPETLDFDATVSSIVKENCANNSENKSVVSDQNSKLKSSSEESKGTQIGNKTTSEDSKAEEKTMTDESSVKQTQNKSLMLADLLDKKEGPALNGVLGKDLRIGEKGLELVEKAILKETHLNNKGISVKKDSVVNVNGETRTGVEHSTVINNAIPAPGSKRPAANEKSVEETQEKRRKLSSENAEGNEKGKPETKGSEEVKAKEEEDEEVNGEEEVKASSTAASLFAALAAETLKDETEDEVPSDPQPQTVVVPGGQIRPLYLTESSPILVTASGNRQIIMTPSQLSQQGQVLISAGGQSLPVIVQNQRIVQGVSGQMLVASQPQQYIMSGNSQNQMLIAQPQTALVQGQPQTVLVAQAPQQPGTKTIIILQPQSQGTSSPQQGKMVVTSQGTPMVVTTSVPRQVVQPTSTPPLAAPTPTSVVPTSTSSRETTTDVVLSSGVQNNPPVSSLNQNGSQIQIISSGVQNNAPILNQNSKDKNKTQNSTSKTTTPAKLTDASVFLCEWRGCMRSFKTANEVYMHVCNTHCPANAEVETQCLWERCDGMKRKRFSLMTHLFDRHCNADALNMMAVRRKQLSTQGRTEIPAPTPPPPHPGYAPNAAFHAIKRHALEFVNPKELLKANGAKSPPPPAPPPPSAVLLAKVASPPVQVKDDNEGPVTKSIRLTASLILRNLVIYSSVGRRFLKGYEPHLASIALSNVESSRTIAQVLADLNDSSSR